MELIGRITIHPVLFCSGKVAGYLLWILFALDYVGVHVIPRLHGTILDVLSATAWIVGFAFIALSFLSLGRSIRFGLPTQSTELKTSGVYRLSRNPMYVGFDALTLAAILRFGSLVVLLLGIYSAVVYHLIILGEERFLELTFGRQYDHYKTRVRRYV